MTLNYMRKNSETRGIIYGNAYAQKFSNQSPILRNPHKNSETRPDKNLETTPVKNLETRDGKIF